MNEKNDVIKLIDDEGTEFEFKVVDIFTADKNKYAVLIPLKDELPDTVHTHAEETDDYYEDDDDGEAIIMRVIDGSDGETSLHVIDDEDEWQKAADIAMERLLDN